MCYTTAHLSYLKTPVRNYFCCKTNSIKRFKITTMKTKMKLIASLKIWVVIYPSITLFLFIFGQALSALHLYQRTFLLTITLVPWVMFVGVPLVDSFIRMFNAKNKISN